MNTGIIDKIANSKYFRMCLKAAKEVVCTIQEDGTMLFFSELLACPYYHVVRFNWNNELRRLTIYVIEYSAETKEKVDRGIEVIAKDLAENHIK